MGYVDVLFPVDISYHSKGGPGFNTNIAVSDSGAEERVARWNSAKCQFDVRYGIKSRDQMSSVLTFYRAMQGAANSFRWKDWLDYNTSVPGHHEPSPTDNTTAFDAVVGTGDAATTRFQLVKQYTEGSITRTRTINKPVSGTVKIALNGTITSAYSLDYTTGIVTFTSAPASGASITWGGEFNVEVRFGKENDKALMAAIDDWGYGSLDPIVLVEVPAGTAVDDDANCGGAREVILSANYSIGAGYCRAYLVQAQGGGLAMILPDPTNLPGGGPYFWIANIGASNSFNVNLHSGGTLAALSPGQGVDLILTVDGSGTKAWTMI